MQIKSIENEHIFLFRKEFVITQKLLQCAVETHCEHFYERIMPGC